MTWFARPIANTVPSSDVIDSRLFEEKMFYSTFLQDLAGATREVILDSPFMTVHSLRSMKSAFESLVIREVRIIVVTKPPSELDEAMAEQQEVGIQYFEKLGVQVLLCKDHHRKLAMIDRSILWEGSLNILSQNRSREFMRRIESKVLSEEMFCFLKYDKTKLFPK